MSILIKGMEMPKRCAECWLMDGEDSWCTACRGRHLCPEYRYGIKDRPDWCTLFPVPPHGRLIDADALIEDLTLDDGSENSGAPLLMSIFLEVLKAAPTIIPACEEVYDKYTDTAGNLHWTGTHSGKHIVKAEEGET